MDISIKLKKTIYPSWWRNMLYQILVWLGIRNWLGRTFDLWVMPTKIVEYSPGIPFIQVFGGPYEAGDMQLHHDKVIYHFDAKTGNVRSNVYAKGRHGRQIGYEVEAHRTTARQDSNFGWR